MVRKIVRDVIFLGQKSTDASQRKRRETHQIQQRRMDGSKLRR